MTWWWVENKEWDWDASPYYHVAYELHHLNSVSYCRGRLNYVFLFFKTAHTSISIYIQTVKMALKCSSSNEAYLIPHIQNQYKKKKIRYTEQKCMSSKYTKASSIKYHVQD